MHACVHRHVIVCACVLMHCFHVCLYTSISKRRHNFRIASFLSECMSAWQCVHLSMPASAVVCGLRLNV